MSSDILTARKGPVLEITLNRPQIGNAASDAMAVELTKLLLGAAESSEIVVLRGVGDDFCVGRETMGKRPPGPPPQALELCRRNDVVFNCYGVWSTAVIGPQRALEAGIVSEIVPEAQLEAAVETLCKQIMAAPRPARVGCKDYARAALDLDVAGAIEFARSIHAVINSSSEMLPAGHK
jgi:enoyl-CoA hydratase/carnithine racemase